MTEEELRLKYVEQRYAHITQDVERMSSWIWDALWSFADDMDSGQLEQEIKNWSEDDD
jgi:hypothetical protein